MQQIDVQKESIIKLLTTLLDQNRARILFPANQQKLGFWFGGGNIVTDENDTLWICGRYRDYGDSRTGIDKGTRGWNLVIYRSEDNGISFEKVQNWSKEDLSYNNRTVISIEGTALHQLKNGQWELYISTEKMGSYPKDLKAFQKSGTGIWSIDRITGKSPDQLKLDSVSSVLNGMDFPSYLHVKDPVIYEGIKNKTSMLFATHPFSWASGNTGFAERTDDKRSFKLKNWEIVHRGPCWDVASTRITCRMKIPSFGFFKNTSAYSIYFYDGAECMNLLDENEFAFKRPRGYSCEELGGAMIGLDPEFPKIERISLLKPLFTSPWGTGCSRYVKTLITPSGIHAIWQQSQKDGSQPLVYHFLPIQQVEHILSSF